MKENNKDVKWITSILQTTTKQEDVNEDAPITKIYRLIRKKEGTATGRSIFPPNFHSF